MSVAQRQLEQQNYVICAAVLVSSSIKTHDEQNCSEGKLFKRYILVSARNLFQHCTLMPVAHCREAKRLICLLAECAGKAGVVEPLDTNGLADLAVLICNTLAAVEK